MFRLTTTVKNNMRLASVYLLLITAAIIDGENCQQRRRVYVEQTGDVIVAGLFRITETAKQCAQVDGQNGGLGPRLAHAAKWTVDRINQLNYIPNITLGFKAIDVCGEEKAAFTRTIGLFSSSGLPKREACRSEKLIGIMGADKVDTDGSLKKLVNIVGLPFVETITGETRPVMKAIIKILKEMNCTKVTTIAFEGPKMEMFRRSSKQNEICFSETILLHDKASMSDLKSAVRRLESDDTGTFVLFGNDLQIHTLLTVLKTVKIPKDSTWIISGVSKLNHSLVTRGLEIKDFIVVQADRGAEELKMETSYVESIKNGGGPLYVGLFMEWKKCLSSNPDGDHCDISLNYDPFYVLQNGVLPVFAIANALRAAATGKITQQDVDHNMEKAKLLAQIIPEVMSCNFTFYKHSVDGISQIGTFQMTDYPLMVQQTDPTKHGCRCTGGCGPPTIVQTDSSKHLLYRYDTWVIVCLTISGCGLLTDLIILLYITVYVLRKKRTEGSQFFTIVLIIGNISLFVSILPFALKPSAIVCLLKVFAPSAALAVIFSTMIARTLLTVTADIKGFQGHVSGALQAIIFIVLLISEVMLLVLLWWFKQAEIFTGSACLANHTFQIVVNGYDSFLLVLLAFICPFAARNRRNYKEGLQFCISTILVVCIWSSWIMYNFTQPKPTHDPCSCITIVAIATTQLIVIFIPRACSIAMVPQTNSYGIPTVSGNHLSAASQTNLCQTNQNPMRVYETINRGYVPGDDERDRVNGNPYMIPDVSRYPESARTIVYRKATII